MALLLTRGVPAQSFGVNLTPLSLTFHQIHQQIPFALFWKEFPKPTSYHPLQLPTWFTMFPGHLHMVAMVILWKYKADQISALVKSPQWFITLRTKSKALSKTWFLLTTLSHTGLWAGLHKQVYLGPRAFVPAAPSDWKASLHNPAPETHWCSPFLHVSFKYHLLLFPYLKQ